MEYSASTPSFDSAYENHATDFDLHYQILKLAVQRGKPVKQADITVVENLFTLMTRAREAAHQYQGIAATSPAMILSDDANRHLQVVSMTHAEKYDDEEIRRVIEEARASLPIEPAIRYSHY